MFAEPLMFCNDETCKLNGAHLQTHAYNNVSQFVIPLLVLGMHIRAKTPSLFAASWYVARPLAKLKQLLSKVNCPRRSCHPWYNLRNGTMTGTTTSLMVQSCSIKPKIIWCRATVPEAQYAQWAQKVTLFYMTWFFFTANGNMTSPWHLSLI